MRINDYYIFNVINEIIILVSFYIPNINSL